jgi:ketosteroid isomerase-like protein
MVGCQDKAAMAELEELKAQAEVEEQNKELTREMWEAWSKGDFEVFKELLAPDCAYYYPSRITKPMSREELIEIGKMLQKAFPDISWSMEELIATEDKTIIRFSGILINRIENGKIVEAREELDQLGMMMQLGMELKPKEE